MSYSDHDAAAFYQAAFNSPESSTDHTDSSPRLPLIKKSPRTRGLDLKMSQQPLLIQVRPLDLKRKGQGYQRLSVNPSILEGSSPDTATTHASPPLNTSGSTDEPTSSLSLGPQRSPFTTTPLSLSLNAVGQHFLDMTLASDGHVPAAPPAADEGIKFIPTSSSKPIRPRRPSLSLLNIEETPLNISRLHSFDDVRLGLSPPITPGMASGSRMMTPRSMSSPLLPRRSSEPDHPHQLQRLADSTTIFSTPNIPTKASETLGTFDPTEEFTDERPMTPLRAGAKALRLLGGLEDTTIGKKGKLAGRRKEYGLLGHKSGDTTMTNINNDSLFQMYSLKGKSRKITPDAHVPAEPAPIKYDPAQHYHHPAFNMSNANALSNETVVGVLPLPRKMDRSPLSRCPSPDTQSERSFDHSEPRRSGEDLLDDVVIVGQDGHRSSGEHDRERDRYEVVRMVHSVPRKKIASRDMAFLASDPYARTRGPSPASGQKRRPPPLALTLSNGKTTSMPDRVPQSQTRLAPEQIRQGETIDRHPARISSLPYTPFSRPRAAPAPPQVGRSSSDSVVRPLLSTDLPMDVSPTSDPNEPIPILDDPHRKGRSFFIEDESPTQGTFGISLAKKITLKGMGESWKKAVANRV